MRRGPITFSCLHFERLRWSASVDIFCAHFFSLGTDGSPTVQIRTAWLMWKNILATGFQEGEGCVTSVKSRTVKRISFVLPAGTFCRIAYLSLFIEFCDKQLHSLLNCEVLNQPTEPYRLPRLLLIWPRTFQ
jgi:hypothetical protein